ncbi:ER membrane protein complex subunit 2, partial [Tremellales sp. Uapishka_1]
MVSSDLEQLSRWRTVGARHSQQVVERATRVLKSTGLGDQEWSIREQLAMAAFDLGKTNLGAEQLLILNKRFPDSPRVHLLHGLGLEARGDLEGARKAYEDLLLDDECNVSAQQRLITLSLSSPTIDVSKTIAALLKYLDTFYTDPSAWSFLAELYADLGLYPQSMAALGHLMLIQTWDSAAVQRAGETAFTMGDYQLALKYFLRATEMETEPSGTTEASTKSRSWWGVKLATRRLLNLSNSDSSVPSNLSSSPKQLRLLDELATERLLAFGGAGLGVRRKVLAGAEKTR